MSSAVSNILEAIHEKAGISFREIAQLMNTTPETVSRWKTGRIDPQPDRFKKLATLAWLVDELAEFYKPDEAKLWLFKPQRLLGNARPADRIEQDRLEDVLALIKQLQDGAFV
jgi:transcriptional regulator with XRE-family HTH domain